MTSWIPRAGVAAFLLVSLGALGWADTTASNFRVNGDTAVAEFQATSPTNACLQFFVMVLASDRMEKLSPGGGPTTVAGTTLLVGEQDVCLGVPLLSGEGEATQQAFRIAGDLSSATLTTTVTVFDNVSLQSFTFAVNLTWTAVGPPEFHHDTERFQDKSLGILIESQIRGTTVDAEATGTVVGLGVNFTPQPSNAAELQSQNDGTVTIQMGK
jgi:hypothetical protein